MQLFLSVPTSVTLLLLCACTCICMLTTISAATGKIHSSFKGEKAVAKRPINAAAALNMSVVTWNMAEVAPTEEECAFIRGFREQDIVVFGIQECEDIKPRRKEGHRSRRWRDIHAKMLGKKQFTCIARHKMGGLLIAVFAKKTLNTKSRLIQGVQILDVACGVGNVLTNKGAVMANIRIAGKTLCLVNAHMAAHQSKVKERNADFHRIWNALTERTLHGWLLPRPFTSSTSATATGATTTGVAVETSKRAAVRGNGATATSAAAKESKKRRKSAATSGVMRKGKKKLALVQRSSRSSNLEDFPTIEESVHHNPFDAIVFFGDLNYRTDLPRLEIMRVDDAFKKRSARGIALAAAAVATKDRKKTASRSAKSNDGTNSFKSTATSAAPATVELSSALREMKQQWVVNYNSKDPATVQHVKRLLLFDQLSKQRGLGEVFQGFHEGCVMFPPSFKYDKLSDRFDSSEKKRCPAWTDRILFADQRQHTTATATVSSSESESDSGSSSDSSSGNSDSSSRSKGSDDCSSSRGSSSSSSGMLELVDYYCIDARDSDHRPVCADFRIHL